jgi:hypothetical protein
MTDTLENTASSKDPLELWYLCRTYSLVQAALLIAGHDPAAFENVEQLTWEKRPKGYEAVKAALVKHIERRGDFGNQVWLDQRSMQGTDLHRSTVSFVEVREWLADHGHVDGFFGRKEKTKTLPSYLNKRHPRYAPKLAAAVAAWEAIEETAKSRAKSPKNIIRDWLMEHAAEFELLKDDGSLNNEGIEDVAKVANWRLKGGAPSTPDKS